MRTHIVNIEVQTEMPPKMEGVYVVYTEHSIGGSDFPYPEKQLLLFHSGVWSYLGSDQNYRGKVYGYVGPLPQPTIKSLLKANVSFAVGTYYKGGRGGDVGYHNGPFPTIKEALDIHGSEGEFIFKFTEGKGTKESYQWCNDEWVKCTKL